MNRDILNIILNDVLNNDINSIKKTSLICKNIHNNIQLLIQTNTIKNKLNILQKYSNRSNCLYEVAKNVNFYLSNIAPLMIEMDARQSIDLNDVISCAIILIAEMVKCIMQHMVVITT